MTHILVTIAGLLLIIIFFWGIIWLVWSDSFHAEAPVDEPPEAREAREAREERELINDLAQDVNVINFQVENVDQLLGTITKKDRRLLTDLGIAENRTAVREDEEAGKNTPTDSWLSDNRPFWLACLQFTIGIIPALILGLLMPVPLAVLVSFIGATVFIGLTSWTIVEENTVVGVKRLGRQCNGYLPAGPNFLLLPALNVEVPEIVPLYDIVWGPKLGTAEDKDKEKEVEDRFHLNGALGSDENPKPGEFHVILYGTWAIKVIVLITLRVRRSRKKYWWHWLNSYASEQEIAEQIAGLSLAILTTLAREVKRDLDKYYKKPPKNKEEEFRRSAAYVLVMLNRVPEISSSILFGMQELGRKRLGGIIAVSTAITSVVPEEKFMDLQQQADTALMSRLKQQIDADGTLARLNTVKKGLEGLTPEDKKLLLQLEQMDTQRAFAQGKSGIDTIVQAMGMNLTHAS